MRYMKPRAYSNLKTLELLFQDKNSAQETKKKSSKKRGHVYRPEEITGENYIRGTNYCLHIVVHVTE